MGGRSHLSRHLPTVTSPFRRHARCSTRSTQGISIQRKLRSFGFAAVGEEVQIAKNCSIHQLGNIRIGDGVRIDGFSTIVASGPLVIGRYVHIHTSVVIGSRGGITIGDFCGISHNCQLLSASDDFRGAWMTNDNLFAGCTRPKVAPIVIGRHVPVRVGSTILPGISIGEGAAICAHSLVTRDMPDWMMCSGVPARPRVARRRTLLELERKFIPPLGSPTGA